MNAVPEPSISKEERAWRQASVAAARGSVRLEGFVLDADIKRISQRYIDGELSGDEHVAAVRAAVLNGCEFSGHVAQVVRPTANRTDQHRVQGGTISSVSPRKAIVNKSNRVSEQNSNGSKPSEASAKTPTDKPSVKLPFVSEEEWLQAIQEGTKRMSHDEAFRLEIAQQLS